MRDNEVGMDAEDMAALAKALGGVYTNQSTRSLSPYEAQLLSEEIQSKMPNEEPRGFGFYKPDK